MNTWGYLILIAALLVLSAFMIYARFAGRSREKSLHHAPAESAALMILPPPEPVEVEDAPSSDPLVMDLKPLGKAPVDETVSEETAEESTYFDELQEAAAGLAMLMRSSPAQDRSNPVIFAPDESETETANEVGVSDEQVEELIESQEVESAEIQSDVQISLRADETGGVIEDSVAERIEVTEPVEIEAEAEIFADEWITEPIEIGDEVDVVVDEGETTPIEITVESVPTSEETIELSVNVVSEIDDEELAPISEAMDSVEALLDEGPSFDGAEDEIAVATEKTSTPAVSLELVLGEEVAQQFARLDSGLDELESLVKSIEDQLGGLDDFISAQLDDEEVSEAA